MLSATVEDGLNEHLNLEFSSYYLYLSMAAYFSKKNLSGFAHWMRLQAEEERLHAMKIFDYLVRSGGRVALKPIQAPPGEWKSPREVIEQVAEHEAMITRSIHHLYETARREKDHATAVMLQWFITEQVEEEQQVAEILGILEMIESRQSALLMLDHRLAKRTE